MKNQTLTKRAAAIRHDYSPLSGPPNPQAAEARADMMAYGRQLLNNPPPVVEPQAEQKPPVILVTFSGPDAPPLYPLDRPAVEWVTFADDTGCGLWRDDPATIGDYDDNS
jgi:hypothetical protein